MTIEVADKQLERYPAVLIISRGPTQTSPDIKVIVDDKVLHNSDEVTALLAQYEMADRAYNSIGRYTYTIVPLEDAEHVAAEIRAELEGKSGAGSADTLPARTPQKPPKSETPKAEDTTKAASRQVELIVVYETDQATARPRLHNGGELMSLKVDGKPATPPTTDLNQLYRLLQSRGYAPAGFEWLGRAVGSKRQRRQLYVQQAQA